MNIKKGITRLFWVSFAICNVIGLLFGIRQANFQARGFENIMGKPLSDFDYYVNYIIGTALEYDIFFLMFTALAYIVIKTIIYVINGFKQV